MALDGIFLHHIKEELKEKIFDTRVEKIYQPSKEELVLALRGRNGAFKLLLSARANSPRINLTSHSLENPQTPPMLCMLLRKKLGGARVKDVEQINLERMLKITFDATNELGDKIKLYLIIEIMGKHSNIILVDEDLKIIDPLKRIDMLISQKRLVLPGITYELPPSQDKYCLLDESKTTQELVSYILDTEKNMALNKAILNKLQGVSPIICRELEHLTGRGQDIFTTSITDDEKTRLSFFLNRLIETIKTTNGTPYIVYDIKTNKPLDFSFTQITQYSTMAKVTKTQSFSSLLDNFYFERDRSERINVKGQDLLKILSNISQRLSRKINTQKAQLLKSTDREILRIKADLLQANLYRIEKGITKIEVENFYEENLPILKIDLDPALTPSQNAQKYYKLYNKAKTAEQMLKIQIEKAIIELDYIESVFDSLSRAEKESELSHIREELANEGYVKKNRNAKKNKKPATLPFIEFTSSSGFRILVGRNNVQNDLLTLKTAKNYDLWFHTKNIPGSHTVVISDNREIDDETILQAASIAAYHSKAKESDNVPVDYALIKYVSKPSGAKPGMVIYKNNKTIYVKPDIKIVNSEE